LLRGPSADESINIESAQLALAEAERRARGEKEPDAALDQKRNNLDVRRARVSLEQAQGAHGKAVVAAQERVESSTRAVADAQQAEADAAKGADDARRALIDSADKIAIAESNLIDAHVDVMKAAVDLDKAHRDLMAGFASSDIPLDQGKEALKRWMDQGLLTEKQAWNVTMALLAMKKTVEGQDPDAAAKQAAPAVMGPVTQTPEQQQKIADDKAVLDEVWRRGQGASNFTPDQARDWLYHHPEKTPAPDPPSRRKHAMGGDLVEGWNLLGEQGPELAIKRGSLVSVATASATRSMLMPQPISASSAPASNAPGGYVHNGDIVIGTATARTAADIVYAQRKLAIKSAAAA
jgi:hypothetical protein